MDRLVGTAAVPCYISALQWSRYTLVPWSLADPNVQGTDGVPCGGQRVYLSFLWSRYNYYTPRYTCELFSLMLIVVVVITQLYSVPVVSNFYIIIVVVLLIDSRACALRI